MTARDSWQPPGWRLGWPVAARAMPCLSDRAPTSPAIERAGIDLFVDQRARSLGIDQGDAAGACGLGEGLAADRRQAEVGEQRLEARRQLDGDQRLAHSGHT